MPVLPGSTYMGRDVVERKTVEAMLIGTAYGVHERQLRGVPDWARTERCDVAGDREVQGHPDHGQMQSLVTETAVGTVRVQCYTKSQQRDGGVCPDGGEGRTPDGAKSTGDPNGPSPGKRTARQRGTADDATSRTSR